MESLENRKSAVTVELPKIDPQQESTIMNVVVPDTKSSIIKKTTSVKFNKVSRTKSLSINAKKSSEKQVNRETKNDPSSDEAPNNSEEVAEQSFHDTAVKSSSVIGKSSEGLCMIPSNKLGIKSSEERAIFSQILSVNNSIEKVVFPATGMRNSESCMENNTDVEKSTKSSFGELNTPTGLILGLVIALAIALWYGIQNGRFKAFLTPALRGYDSESSSAYDDASIRYHDILPFDAEPYDDPPNAPE